jgi:fatty-acyl-CoA synthase
MTFVGLGEWLERREQLTPEKIGLIDVETDTRLTYRALNCRARALAALLREHHGVQAGERVAVLAANAPEYLDALFATALLGAILVPLNWRLTTPELLGILRDCSPVLLLHDETHAEHAREVVAALASAPAASTAPPAAEAASARDQHNGHARRSWWHWGGAREERRAVATAPARERPIGLLAFGAFPSADASLAARAVAFTSADGEEPALILYTSGTTGISKGALLSHRMITWNAVNTQISWGLRDTDSTPIFSPFFHAGGLNVLTTPLYHCGGTVSVLRSADPALILRTVEREQHTLLFAVPTVFQMLMEHPDFDRADLSSLRLCLTGGSSCPLPVIQRYTERGLVFRQGYGLTEVGVNCFSLAPEDALDRPGSVGKPVFHSRARIVDDDDRDVARGEVGELVLAGPHVCSGYWQRPEATAEAFRGGWWHTGDQASQDADGFYFIVGRKKDMYKSGGENVYPAEVEAVLATHPDIADVTVIAEPDPKWGEVGVAIVVPRVPGSLTEEDVIAFCEGRLARFKIPRRVVFVDELPRNAMGKVLKAELRAQHARS